MWFAFGLITVSVSAWLILYWRLRNRWSGKAGFLGDQRYEYSISKHKGRVQQLKIAIACRTGMHFRLKCESLIDRFFKSLGLSEEQQLNRLHFDENVYVESDDRRLSYVLKHKSDLHETLGRFFDGRVLASFKIKRLWCRGERIWIEARPASSMKDCSPEPLAAEVVPVLAKLAEGLASTAPASSGSRDGFVWKAALLTALSAALAINGVLQLVHTAAVKFPVVVEHSARLSAAAALGAGLLLALLFACVLLLGRTSRSHVVLIELLLVGGFGAFASAYSGLRDFNIEFDRARPETVDTRVVNRYSKRCGKNSTCYHLVVEPRPGLGGQHSFKVSYSDYQVLAVGQTVFFEAYTGALGYRWIAAPRPLNGSER